MLNLKINGLKSFTKCMTLSLSAMLIIGISGCELADKAFEGHQTVNIWPGVAPGSENWSEKEFVGFNSITNVKTPTLTIFEPDPALANGTAFVICPGGGFQGLSVIKEGSMVAEWLAARGIKAIVLKYRVRRSQDESESQEGDDFDQRAKALEAGRQLARADGIQAMRYLREHANELNIHPDRIGMMGFSAGAMTTMSVVVEGDAETRPNLAGTIYGAMPGQVPPDNAPPLFIVHAKDDDVVPAEKSAQIYSAWKSAGYSADIHLYEDGGHGFGAKPSGSSADDWMNKFEQWLIGQGWVVSVDRT